MPKFTKEEQKNFKFFLFKKLNGVVTYTIVGVDGKKTVYTE